MLRPMQEKATHPLQWVATLRRLWATTLARRPMHTLPSMAADTHLWEETRTQPWGRAILRWKEPRWLTVWTRLPSGRRAHQKDRFTRLRHRQFHTRASLVLVMVHRPLVASRTVPNGPIRGRLGYLNAHWQHDQKRYPLLFDRGMVQ